MPVLFIPPGLRDLTAGHEQVTVPGTTVRAALSALDELYPGAAAHLLEGDRLRPGITVVVDGVASRQRLRHPLGKNSEVHFLPAIGGG